MATPKREAAEITAGATPRAQSAGGSVPKEHNLLRIWGVEGETGGAFGVGERGELQGLVDREIRHTRKGDAVERKIEFDWRNEDQNCGVDQSHRRRRRELQGGEGLVRRRNQEIAAESRLRNPSSSCWGWRFLNVWVIFVLRLNWINDPLIIC